MVARDEPTVAPRIVVVGSCNTDMVVRCSRLPERGETVIGGDFLSAPGGKGANQAVAAARLGASVRFIGTVGTDAMGEAALRNLTECGVNTSYVRRDAARPSGIALILVDDAGENYIAVAPGANMALTADDVDVAGPVLADVRVAVGQLEVPPAATAHAFRLAQEAGAATVLNAAPAAEVPRELLERADHLVVNENEAALLAQRRGGGTAPEELAEVLLGRGHRAVVVTLGGAGVCYATQEECRVLPAFRVRAIDATGAGDAFVGSFAYMLAVGRGPREAVWYANAVAALATTRVGAQAALPDQREVQRFLVTGGALWA